MTPQISVVIPTFRRPEHLPRAVQSALDQTLRAIEVIVVFDGEDLTGKERVDAMGDPRLRVVEQAHGGQDAATNLGIREARAPWVALLDDDDEWMDEKLSLQYETAMASRFAQPVVGCRLLARARSADHVWPRRAPEPDEPIGDYLFRRRDWFFGEAMFQNSVIFAPTKLFRDCPIGPVHTDWDWLLRVGALPGVGFELVPDMRPLVRWDNDRGRPRASTGEHWKRSFAWIQDSRGRVSEAAYAGFLLRILAADARREGSWDACLPLMREALRRGKVSWKDLSTFVGIWFTPPRMRELVHRRVTSGD